MLMTSKTTIKRTTEKDYLDKNGNLICPTCKKPLTGLLTNVSESTVTVDKHTTKKRKIQCCSEECTAKYFENQQKSLEE
jgi:hypothetical protein